MAAPVVPTMLAIPVPSASIAVLTAASRAGCPDEDAARDGVERKQHHDEAQELAEQRMRQHRGGAAAP